MFRKINGFTIRGKSQVHIDVKFQYFHNYWQTVTEKNNYVFFDDFHRFESHRTLLEKIENQVRYNFYHAFSNMEYLLFNNELFGKSNIIAEKQNIQDIKNKIFNLNPSKASYQDGKNKSVIIQEVKNLKKEVLSNYPKKILKSLNSVICNNIPITKDDKIYIRFLVNACVVELFDKGYKEDYIASVPDIIINKEQFPFKKQLSDFKTKEQYEEYKKSKLHHFTLVKSLSGIYNLLDKVEKNGYYIFRIDHISIIEPHPIKIFDVIFYDPNRLSFISIRDLKDELAKRDKEAEQFYSPLKGSDYDKSKASTCNALVPSKYLTHELYESNSNLYKAFHKATKALDVLNTICDGKGEIKIHKRLKIHTNKKIATFGFSAFGEDKKDINISDDIMLKGLKYKTILINRAKVNSRLGSILMSIVATIDKLKKSEEFFNFKDLWILWESIFSDKKRISEVAFNCMYIDYKEGYLRRMKGFLHHHLYIPYNQPVPYRWGIENHKLKDWGLDMPCGKIITTDKFRANYKMIQSEVPIEIIEDSVERLDRFLNNKTLFFGNLKKWVNNTITEVYIERNSEVHSDIKNDQSKIKLRENFLKMSETMVYLILQYTDNRKKDDVQHVIKKIEAEKNRLELLP